MKSGSLEESEGPSETSAEEERLSKK